LRWEGRRQKAALHLHPPMDGPVSPIQSAGVVRSSLHVRNFTRTPNFLCVAAVGEAIVLEEGRGDENLQAANTCSSSGVGPCSQQPWSHPGGVRW
ncbi:unnamed protein product, partial [Ectocarpus sp. 12 AP-2014]